MYKYFASLILVALFLSGCLKTDIPDQPIQFQLVFQVNELGDLHEHNDDTIIINEFKFAIDQFNLIAEDSLVLGSSEEIDSMIFFYRDDMSNENLVISVDLGFQDVNLFEGYEMFLKPVDEFANIDDQDFFSSDENYSIIAKGEYNGNEFTYNSSISFDKYENLGNVQVGDGNETLVIKKTLNILEIFLDDSEQNIIDPTNTSNESVINSLFEENLIIEGFALTRISEEY